MPIQFRCPACDRLLGIAKRKAGSQVNCPRCGAGVRVPALAGMAIETDGPTAHSLVTPIEPVTKNGHRGGPLPEPVHVPIKPLENLPLFERPDFENLLNPALPNVNEEKNRSRPRTAERAQRPITEEFPADAIVETVGTTGVDVLTGVVVSRTQMIVAAVAIAVLLGVSFGAGYFLAATTVAVKKA